MPKYIDADALLREAKRLSGPQTGDGWDNWGVYALIGRQPAADVEPVRHGRWIDENPASFWDPLMHCSVCGEVNIPLAKWRFCPMCGAKMDEESPKGENND